MYVLKRPGQIIKVEYLRGKHYCVLSAAASYSTSHLYTYSYDETKCNLLWRRPVVCVSLF